MDSFLEIDYPAYDIAVNAILADSELSDREVATRLTLLEVPTKPIKLLDSYQLLRIAEEAHIHSVANRLRTDIARAISDKHIGYFITATIADNSDSDKLEDLLFRILKSKFARESTLLDHSFEMTESKLLHFHLFIENSNRLQKVQILKMAKTVKLEKVNIDVLPIKKNNGLQAYIHKCDSYELYKAYCLKNEKDYNPQRVTDILDYQKTRAPKPL